MLKGSETVALENFMQAELVTYYGGAKSEAPQNRRVCMKRLIEATETLVVLSHEVKDSITRGAARGRRPAPRGGESGFVDSTFSQLKQRSETLFYAEKV
ncbi:hypothetical protein EVAR_26942_1 [Eumeta japonica]|uniref:Uncharacterized protein n=1 Tax=Eumeta variegata TaxID=151549 RepID=A0A4C1VJJ1_EUMVA|nr:hypothetical protein EVAR_26942_1 [Eumeta japonica]